MKKGLALSLMLTLMLAACGTTTTDSTGDDSTDLSTVTLGVISPMSGGAAVYGQEMQYIYEYMLPVINAEAAAQGYEFELVYEDGLCDGVAAATSLQKLSDFDGVDFVLGGACSSESLALAPLLEELDMLALSSLSSSPELEGASPNLFSMSYSDEGNGTEVARHLSEYGSVAMLTEQNDFSSAFRDTVVANLGEDTEVLLDLEFATGETNLRNQLEQMKASGAEAVFFNPAPGVSTVPMAKQIVELGEWDAFQITQFVIGGNEEVLALDTDILDGMIVVDAPRVETEEFQMMFDEIEANHGPLSNLGAYYTAAVSDSFMLLTDLIMAHDEDIEAVRNALANDSFDGYLGLGLSFEGQNFVQGIGTANFEIREGALVAL